MILAAAAAADYWMTDVQREREREECFFLLEKRSVWLIDRGS